MNIILAGSVARHSHATKPYSILSSGMNTYTMVEYAVTESRCGYIADEYNPIQTCPATPVTPHANFLSTSINASWIKDQDIDPAARKRISRHQKQKIKLLSLGSNQKPSGCLDLAVITAERATNCATEDIGTNTLLDERTD
jgi:hypothetical protein